MPGSGSNSGGNSGGPGEIVVSAMRGCACSSGTTCPMSDCEESKNCGAGDGCEYNAANVDRFSLRAERVDYAFLP